MILEACVENINEAIRAEAQGAHRIELCDYLAVGGTTPSAGTIQIAKHILTIPIMVLIRPRSGNFVYSNEEIEVIKKDIEFCKQIGVHGVVLGFLNKNNNIDIELTKELIQLARPLEVTFHKAIDETDNIIREFGKLTLLGVDRVLTSGGKESAIEGAEILNKMVTISEGKTKILAAGRITKSNLEQHKQIIQTDEFHGQLIVGDLNK